VSPLWRLVAGPVFAACAVLILILSPTDSPGESWSCMRLRQGVFSDEITACPRVGPIRGGEQHIAPRIASGQITASVLADVTGDGSHEWVLLVWRPWQDWPIQAWVSAPSPIASFHDRDGWSCHLKVIDERSGREIWMSSALPVPMLALVVGDVDGDGLNEVITLEGDYETGRRGPGRHVDVWRWNGFGFNLVARSVPIHARELGLFGPSMDGILTVGVR